MTNRLVLICLFSFLGAACDSPVTDVAVELDTPVLVLPVNGSDTADSVLLDWDDIPEAKQYEVQVSPKRNFSELIHESRVLDRSEDIVSRLPRDVTFYWRTRAKGRDGIIGPWSEVQSFTPVRQAFFPSYPNQVAPENGSKGHETSVMIRWDPVPEALSYHLSVTIDEDMLLYEVDLEGLKTNSYFVEDLVLTYPYWWKVRSLNAAGYSEWSPVWIFEVKFHDN